LLKRLTEGIAPDGSIKNSAEATSTRFKSYDDWLLTRKNALDKAKAGKNDIGTPIDYNFPPGQGGNGTSDRYVVILKYVNRNSMGEGFASIQGAARVPHPTIPGRRVWDSSDIVSVNNGMNRVSTTILWKNNEWVVVSHWPMSAKSVFDPSTGSYIPGQATPHDDIN